MSLRTIRGYRTVSGEVAGLLVGIAPLDLVAAERARLYHIVCAARRPPRVDLGREEAEEVEEHVFPVEVLTSHGCFSEYLHGVGQEPTAQCHICGEDVDTAQHTLEECPAWAEQRRVLRAAVRGYDLSLGTVVDHMVSSDRSRKAVASFSDTVMSEKEAAKRTRKRDPGSAHRVWARGPPSRRRPPPNRRGALSGTVRGSPPRQVTSPSQKGGKANKRRRPSERGVS
ncbi:uncharacterized protein LOC128895370 [Hylaeus anthracinus]|uniref:uncharacterized protein LOC128895370 n=1 Tax=Hylaeus anthracinus TaxID=313031 RepID=UPI0023B98158|nr:uncharacterized protein LOC128895370 [Hylaeus anthracinus]